MTGSSASRSGDLIAGLLVTLLATVLCIVGAAWILGLTLEAWPRLTPTIPIVVAASKLAVMEVRPEPVERGIFVVLAAIVPVALVVWFRLRPHRTVDRRRWVRWALPTVVAALFAYPFANSEFLRVAFFPSPWTLVHWWQMMAGALLVSIAVIAHSLLGQARPRSTGWTVAAAAGAALVLQILPWRIAPIGSVTTDEARSTSFDAVIYAQSQVIGGKTLLADLPSQYGFFPELLAPLFRVIGFSVLSFTGLLAGLQVVGLCAIALLLRRHVRSGPLAVLTFLALLVPTSLFLLRNYGSTTELYLQYFPVRFVLPAVALQLFALYACRPRRVLLVVLAVISGIAFVWNLDSGVPVVVAIAASLFVKPLFAERTTLESFRRPAAFCLLAATTVTLFFIVLRWKAGAPLHIAQALAYQKIFYGSGFGMLPLPLPIHPWQSVLAIYVCGAIVALAGWRRRSTDSVYDVLFCASLLGTGLFAYYQGRSHIFCFMMVLWPAMLIGAVMTDLALRAVRRGKTTPASITLALPFVCFVSLGTIALASAVPVLIKAGSRSIASFHAFEDPLVADEIGFMRATRQGRSCLILSQRQAIYYAELGTASPLGGPGLIETILQRDLDTLRAETLSRPLDCIYLGVGEWSQPLVEVVSEALLAKYPVSQTSELGTMRLLLPRP